MKKLKQSETTRLVSGMNSNWDASIGLHRKMGFVTHRRLTQCRILNIFPMPPKDEVGDAGTHD